MRTAIDGARAAGMSVSLFRGVGQATGERASWVLRPASSPSEGDHGSPALTAGAERDRVRRSMTESAPLIRYDAMGQAGRVALELRQRPLGVLLTMQGAWHDAVPAATVLEIQQAIAAARPGALGVDLSGCSHMSSVTLGFLVVVWQTAQSAGAGRAAILATPKVGTVLKLIGLHQFFAPVRSRAELEALLGAAP